MKIRLQGRQRIGFWVWIMIFGFIAVMLGTDGGFDAIPFFVGIGIFALCIYKIVKIWNEG